MTRMSSVAHPPLEHGEFLALQEKAGWTLPVELIDGEAVVMPPTGGSASSAQGELFHALRRWQERTGDDGLLLQDVFVHLVGGRYLAPDISWWSPVRRPKLEHGAVGATPDLVIEVLSPSTRANDLGVKRETYLASNVPEIWLVDPDARTVAVVAAGSADRTIAGDEDVSSPLLPGFAISARDIFAV